MSDWQCPCDACNGIGPEDMEGPPDSHEFDRYVLDSGDVIWQNWMTGYDWAPENSNLPWMPYRQVVTIR